MFEMTAYNLLLVINWPFQFIWYTTIFSCFTSLTMQNHSFFKTFPGSHTKTEARKQPKASILMHNIDFLKIFHLVADALYFYNNLYTILTHEFHILASWSCTCTCLWKQLSVIPNGSSANFATGENNAFLSIATNNWFSYAITLYWFFTTPFCLK